MVSASLLQSTLHSDLPNGLEYVPDIRTFKLRTFKDADVHLVPARNQHLCHQGQAWVELQLTLRPLWLTIPQLYRLPPPLPPPGSDSPCLFTRCQPLDASCCTGLLYFPRYCTVRLKMFPLFFAFCFFMYYLCEKYYKPITVRYYIADCVSWVPRLTLLDLRTNWTYERALGTELVRM